MPKADENQIAFEKVAQSVCEYTVTFGASGNPTPESEQLLFLVTSYFSRQKYPNLRHAVLQLLQHTLLLHILRNVPIASMGWLVIA